MAQVPTKTNSLQVIQMGFSPMKNPVKSVSLISFYFSLKLLSLVCSSLFSSVTQLCLTLCDRWTAACQASLSITNSWSILKLISIESVMPSNRLILCCLLLLLPSIFPSITVFSTSQFFLSGGQSIGVSASTSVLPMNIQD